MGLGMHIAYRAADRAAALRETLTDYPFRAERMSLASLLKMNKIETLDYICNQENYFGKMARCVRENVPGLIKSIRGKVNPDDYPFEIHMTIKPLEPGKTSIDFEVRSPGSERAVLPEHVYYSIATLDRRSQPDYVTIALLDNAQAVNRPPARPREDPMHASMRRLGYGCAITFIILFLILFGILSLLTQNLPPPSLP